MTSISLTIQLVIENGTAKVTNVSVAGQQPNENTSYVLQLIDRQQVRVPTEESNTVGRPEDGVASSAQSKDKSPRDEQTGDDTEYSPRPLPRRLSPPWLPFSRPHVPPAPMVEEADKNDQSQSRNENAIPLGGQRKRQRSPDDTSAGSGLSPMLRRSNRVQRKTE